ncbi:MAG TPA: STN domain-containing protein [Polyangiaceae bacterium]|nr:MAG: hypothetical protein BWY17_01112 [Deltaproteobacteria bacterium ADurb.Bin207]HPY19561.1 STN domain-containing protein [Polyangiaceae bacterium]HQM08288.1 STN domain-containing protein [Polyangiaceae bacterium]
MFRSRYGAFALLWSMACGGYPEPQQPVCPASVDPEWSAWNPRRTNPSKAMHVPARDTVRIESAIEDDPVDVLLRRARRRLPNLSLHQAPVDETLRWFAEIGQFNVIISAEAGARKVSLSLKNVSLQAAFRAVLASARLEARLLADNIIEVRPKSH